MWYKAKRLVRGCGEDFRSYTGCEKLIHQAFGSGDVEYGGREHTWPSDAEGCTPTLVGYEAFVQQAGELRRKQSIFWESFEET